MSPSVKIAAVGAAVLLLVVIGYVMFASQDEIVMTDRDEGTVLTPSPESERETFTFACPSGESFTTSYDPGTNTLTLTLPNSESYLLEQAVVDSGARYEGGGAVFFENQGEARVETGGQTRFEGCKPVL